MPPEWAHATMSMGSVDGAIRVSSHMSLVDQYQSIADTIVQLFILLPFCCDWLVATRFDREMHNDEKGE
jgi:hypothetical protein